MTNIRFSFFLHLAAAVTLQPDVLALSFYGEAPSVLMAEYQHLLAFFRRRAWPDLRPSSRGTWALNTVLYHRNEFLFQLGREQTDLTLLLTPYKLFISALLTLVHLLLFRSTGSDTWRASTLGETL